MDAEMIKTIKERRADITASAPCEGCGATLSFCKSQRGKDPTAPWFGCCAQGLDLRPCSHRQDPAALRGLLDEIESGHVRTVGDVLLDSVRPFSSPSRAFARMLSTWTDPETDRYGE
jgi:hypothetical protein